MKLSSNCKIYLLFPLFIFLYGCSTTKPISSPQVSSSSQHQADVAQLASWQIKGKLAFISPNERQSANVLWQVKDHAVEKLSLSTFLGINIVDIEQTSEHYLIHADGETHQGNNLALLIWQLTGLTLPVDALSHWLKASPYLPSDKLSYQAQQVLPYQLSSHFNQQQWQVKYRQFKMVNNVMLPHKVDITQGDLTIKLQINRWET
ncbi:outer membrane lipoprotein LolB [Thalassotalea sp. LPB0316]|uniref:lipoprotein insertase outer membrane protein LolB n=1 Tax=Thalassotalea sp. LPB0316 TaxID=2769490 RepID=UPI0018664429|nr:lipoprotein insertase outer membrane protein LolB [Thalassotalea sp. LPB0316]QOL24518.1 outer membrane lipoprotein LolB [Thalassotalea sp. LPB0316]